MEPVGIIEGGVSFLDRADVDTDQIIPKQFLKRVERSGFGEFLDQVEAGDVRVLAVTSAERVDALKDVPTLKESGIDLEFTNWRGVVAPPGISEEDKAVWIDAFTRMHDSEAWKAELEKRGWVDAFATGEEFGTFLKEQDTKVADLLQTLGLA